MLHLGFSSGDWTSSEAKKVPRPHGKKERKKELQDSLILYRIHLDFAGLQRNLTSFSLVHSAIPIPIAVIESMAIICLDLHT